MLKAVHHSQALPCIIFHKWLTTEKARKHCSWYKELFLFTPCHPICFALFLSSHRYTAIQSEGLSHALQWFLHWSRLELIKSSTRQSPTTTVPEPCFQHPEELCVSLAGTACCSSCHTSSLMLIFLSLLFSPDWTLPALLASSFSTHAPSH